jgi:Berberine and berberine like
MMDEGLDWIEATYRDNYDRLTEVKRKYDLNNFFHIDQNIRPQLVWPRILYRAALAAYAHKLMLDLRE